VAGEIVHWELMGPDPARLASFYGGLFGWNAQAVPDMDNYMLVDKSESGVGGAIGSGSVEMPSYQAIYVSVDDIDATLAQAEAAGGKTLMPRTVLPDVVIFALFQDPAGDVIGLVEPGMAD